MTTTPTIGHNLSPKQAALQAIDDLYEEARNFADGEPITTAEMHDVITSLRDQLHEAGKVADALRKEEKKPYDDAIDAIQTEYNPYVQPKRGKVDMGKAALDDLLAAWRKRVAEEKAAAAAELKRAADEAREKAEAAIRASSGNLAAREEAEAILATAKSLDKAANRAGKGPTGLRTVYNVTIVDEAAALDWAYGQDAARFLALVQQMAQEAVRDGKRELPGFSVVEDKVAR